MKASMINHFRYCMNYDFEVFHQKEIIIIS